MRLATPTVEFGIIAGGKGNKKVSVKGCPETTTAD